jgi:hypothetical protein
MIDGSELIKLTKYALTIDGERGTKIPHQIFLDEELGLKKTHQELVTTLELMRAAGSTLKSGSQNLETATCPARMVRAPGRRPSPWGRSLRHFFKSPLLPFPGQMYSTSRRARSRLRKVIRESWE